MTRERASAVILRENQILMVRISDKGGSWWCLPGGAIQPGETPEQAAVRELQEELNLETRPRRSLYESPMPDGGGTDHGVLMDAPVDEPSLGVVPVVAEWAWPPLDAVDDSWQVEEVRKALRTTGGPRTEPL